MQSSVHLVQHELIRSSEHNGASFSSLDSAEIQQLTVAHTLLADFIGFSQVGGVEHLVALKVHHSRHHRAASGLGNPLQVFGLDTPHRDGASLHKVLQTQVINTLGSEDHTSTSIDDVHDLLLGDIHLALTNLFHLLGVRHHNLHTHLKLMFLKVEVQQGNLSIFNRRGHALCGLGGVQSESINQGGVQCALSVTLQNVNVRNGALDLAILLELDSLSSGNGQTGEEV
mmetsp:Transcript_8741/g.14869  ORF Transcript_8741/g.14869 Transcript_8741/m.14869 type:complete len:228 (-) Transcript_8741:543-1226(-)